MTTSTKTTIQFDIYTVNADGSLELYDSTLTGNYEAAGRATRRAAHAEGCVVMLPIVEEVFSDGTRTQGADMTLAIFVRSEKGTLVDRVAKYAYKDVTGWQQEDFKAMV